MRQGTTARRARAAALWLAACAGGAVQAAGGHHSVDDANILSRGDCEQETWFTRGQGNARLLHAGVNCGVGPVELAGAIEHAREPGEGNATRWNAEVKWARELADGIAIGVDVQPYWRLPGSRYAGTAAYGVVTWQATGTLAVHADFGRDFVRGAAGQRIAGVALEYAPGKARSLVLERYVEQGTHFVRVGPRWAIGHVVTVDFSRAQRIAGPAPSAWTLGVSIDLDED